MNHRIKRSAILLAMTAALCGGSTFSSCGIQWSTGAIDGSKEFLFELLNDAALDFILALDPDAAVPV